MHIPKAALGPAIVAGLALGLTACHPRETQVKQTAAADPSAVVIGTTPAAPTGDPPGTTPVDTDSTEVSKSVESNSMPLPGQANDHSNLAATPSQRAETSGVNATAPDSQSANSDQPSQRGSQQ
jgi:hypothetical protein